MITIRMLKHKYQVPDRWSDFTQENAGKFVSMCTAFELFETGRIDFRTLEAGVATSLLGVDVTMIPRQNNTLAENIFRLTEKLRFPYNFQDNDDGSRTASVNVILRTNLLPRIRHWKGYKFHVTKEGMVDCNISAEQYVEALSLMDLYGKTRKDEVLDELFRTLYKRGCQGFRNTFKDSFKATAKDASCIPHCYKAAVYYNLRGILEWIKNLPDFRLIFTPGEKKSGGSSPLGLSGSIFTLSKSGYGTLKEIQELDLFSYLGALVQLNIDGIYSLHTAGLKPGEIAEKMNLPMDCVLPYLTVKEE